MQGLLRRRAWWAEVAVVLAFYLGYAATRALAPGTREQAISHARDVVSLERVLHVDPERVLNHGLSQLDWLSAAAGYYYLSLHFAVTVIVLVLLYLRRPQLYARARSSIVAASFVALFAFWFLPVAPPRLTEGGIVDTVVQHNVFGAAAAQQGHSSFENVYAAMPSLHVGWALWVALVVSRALPGWLGRLSWAYPVATTLVVLSTGNHYVVDALAGAALILASDVVFGVLLKKPRAARAMHSVPASVAETKLGELVELPSEPGQAVAA